MSRLPQCLDLHHLFETSTAASQTTATFNRLSRFTNKSSLRRYLARKHPSSGFVWRRLTTCGEVLAYLQCIIATERLFDANNGAIILADKELEAALNVRAVHVIELCSLVLTQLVAVDQVVPLVPHLVPYDRKVPLGTLAERDRSKSVPISAEDSQRLVQFRLDAYHLARCSDSARREPLAPSTAYSVYISPEALFMLRPKFYRALTASQCIPPDRLTFSYVEIALALTTHLRLLSVQYFDARCPRICIVEGTPLGDAFAVRAFHRTQLVSLLRSQLLPYTAPSPSASSTATSTQT